MMPRLDSPSLWSWMIHTLVKKSKGQLVCAGAHIFEPKSKASGQELGVVLLLSRDVCITSDLF